jgi:hypothetical protein
MEFFFLVFRISDGGQPVILNVLHRQIPLDPTDCVVETRYRSTGPPNKRHQVLTQCVARHSKQDRPHDGSLRLHVRHAVWSKLRVVPDVTALPA